MDILDFFKSQGTRSLAYARDLGVFARRPRLYLSQVASLDTAEMIRRVAFYGLTATMIEFMMFGLVFRSLILSSLDAPWVVLGTAIIETILWFILVPAFWLTARFLKRKEALKLSIHYVAISRFIIVVSGLLLTALFLLTEEYAFTVVRAVVFYLCVLAFLLTFPCALSDSLKKIAGAVLICLCMVIATSFGLVFLIETFRASTTDEINRVHLLYDPIGEEVLGLDIDSSSLSDFDPTTAVVADVSRLGLENLKLELEKLKQEQEKLKLERVKLEQEQEQLKREIEKLDLLLEKLMQKLQNPELKIEILKLQLGNPKIKPKKPELSSESQEQSQPTSVPSFAEAVQSKYKGKWEEIKKQRLDEIEFARKRLEEQRPKLVFRTSKRFVDRRIKQTDLYRSIVLSVDILLSDPSSERVPDWLKSLNSIQDEIREIELGVMQEYLNHIETHLKLLHWGVIM